MKVSRISFFIFLILPFSAHAIEMNYKDSQPVSLTGISEIWTDVKTSGCSNQQGIYEVQEIVYDGKSEVVTGIRVTPVTSIFDRNSSAAPFLISIDTQKLSNVDRSWIPTLVKKGSKLKIDHDLCGSGGFMSAQNIYKISDNSFAKYLALAFAVALLYGVAKYHNIIRKIWVNKPKPYDANAPMTRAKAFDVLGLKEGVTKEEIRQTRKRLLKGLHPDSGGSNALASLINQAADFLLG